MVRDDNRHHVLATRLRSLRKANDLSQAQVASALDITRVCISNYERGTRIPDPHTLMRLAALYNVSVDYLLGNNPQHLYPEVLSTMTNLREQTGTPHIITDQESDGFYILPGDIAMIDSSPPDQGELSLIKIKGELLLARTVPAGNQLAIHTPHSNQPVRILPASQVTIIGRVTAIIVNQTEPATPDQKQT